MKKTKNIPAIVMLLGCLVAAIVTYINKYDLLKTLKVVLIVLCIFLVMGLIIKGLFEKYIPVVEETEESEDEGSVIEKQPEEENSEGQMMESGVKAEDV